MIAIKPNVRSLIWTGALAAVAAAFVFLLFLPAQRSIQEIRAEADRMEQAVADSRDVAGRLRASNEDLHAAGAFVEDWRRFSPEGEEIAELFARISELAATSGVEIIHFDRGVEDDLHLLRRLPVKLECHGRFTGVVEFFSQLEKQEPALWIEELRMERPRGGGGLVVRASLVIFSDRVGDSE